MKTYYRSLDEIEQTTAQLQDTHCPHCQRDQYLLSHGFLYKKQVAGKPPMVVGKRVFCSNRRHHQGCGRTCPLYLADCLRFMRYSATVVWTFVALLIEGICVETAYLKATCALDARHAWRWMDKLMMNVPRLRTAVPAFDEGVFPPLFRRQRFIVETGWALLAHFKSNIIHRFQLQTQRLFLLPVTRFAFL